LSIKPWTYTVRGFLFAIEVSIQHHSRGVIRGLFIIKITIGGFLMASPHNTLNLPRDLGDNLVLRLATPADTEPLARFNHNIHIEDGEPANFLTDWTRVLMSGEHPTMRPEDFVLVEDTGTGQIVSATCLIPQVWQYDGIPIKVGRPELVGTDPAYRRRGLVRAIFEVIHQLSDAYGHQLQGITGIPWYYRQFGYEYALDLGGSRNLHVGKVPELKEDEAEPYQIRQATPFLLYCAFTKSTPKANWLPYPWMRTAGATKLKAAAL